MSDQIRRYWVSWYQPTADYRPVDYPPNKSVLGWWCSGYSDEGATLCAVISGKNQADVYQAIHKDWPEANMYDLRFCEEKPNDWTPSTRFPMSDWMIKRFEHSRPT